VIITHERRKLINAVLFFALRTKKCGITKLFKLLYFLDFEHYKTTGRSITGLNYNAWPKGPVPVPLFEELHNDKLEADLREKIEVEERPLPNNKKFLKINPVGGLDLNVFTKRELRIMEALAVEYENADADAMVEETHLETLPWHQVYEVEKRKQQLIPYEYAVRKDEAEFIQFIKKENDEFLSNYSNVVNDSWNDLI